MKLSLHEQDILLAHVVSKPREFLYSHPEYRGTKAQDQQFQRLCKLRLAGEPIAYLLGHKEFYGLDFLVNKHVLIPRPDTELLVDVVLQRCRDELQCVSTTKKTPFFIADIGTGSGCIAVTLKQHLPTAKMLATDISGAALTVAKKNAFQHKTPITFFRGNLMHALPKKYHGTLDILVSNLPYLSKPEANKKSLAFEPQVALTPTRRDVARNVSTSLIKQLIQQAPLYLKPTGSMFLEIGYRQANIVVKLCQKTWPTARISVQQDLGGFDRVIVCML